MHGTRSAQLEDMDRSGIAISRATILAKFRRAEILRVPPDGYSSGGFSFHCGAGLSPGHLRSPSAAHYSTPPQVFRRPNTFSVPAVVRSALAIVNDRDNALRAAVCDMISSNCFRA